MACLLLVRMLGVQPNSLDSPACSGNSRRSLYRSVLCPCVARWLPAATTPRIDPSQRTHCVGHGPRRDRSCLLAYPRRKNLACSGGGSSCHIGGREQLASEG